MTVSSLHAIVPAAPAAPAGLPQDAAGPDTGFAQALAQRQSHHHDRAAQGHGSRHADRAEPSANGPAGDSATLEDGAVAATQPGVEDKAAPSDADEAATDPALAASMQFADFVRELTSASRAVAARTQAAAGAGAEAPALRAAAGTQPGALPAQGDRIGALSVEPLADDGQPLPPAGAVSPMLARAEAASLSVRPALSGARSDDRVLGRTDARAETTARSDGGAAPVAALNLAAANRPAPAGAAITDSMRAPAAAAIALPTASGAGQPAGSARLATATAVAADAGSVRADATNTTSTTPAWTTAFSTALPPAATASVTPMPAAAPGPNLLEPGVGAPLHSPQWAPALGRQMVLLGSAEGGTIRHAELRLDPPDLGPLRVSLNLSGDQATAVFVSAHPAVRAAVEAALPQLQQALADAGIQLGNTSVGDQSAWQEAQGSGEGRGNGHASGDDDAVQDAAGAQPVITRAAPRGLIDTFA